MTHDPIWRLPDVMRYTGLGKSTIYRKISRQEFPRSTSLGARAIGWRSSWIEKWVQEQIEASCSGDHESVGPKS